MTRHGRGVVVTEIEILSADPVDVTVEVDADDLRPQGFECVGEEPLGGVVIALDLAVLGLWLTLVAPWLFQRVRLAPRPLANA